MYIALNVVSNKATISIRLREPSKSCMMKQILNLCSYFYTIRYVEDDICIVYVRMVSPVFLVISSNSHLYSAYGYMGFLSIIYKSTMKRIEKRKNLKLNLPT